MTRPPQGERDLNPRQERAVDLIATGDYTSKADLSRKAGYNASGPSAPTIQGDALLRNPKIMEAVQERRQTLAEQAGISAIRVLQRVEARASAPETPAATAQRADEYLGDVLSLRDAQGSVVDARSLTIAVTSADVQALARLIAGDTAP